MEEIIIYSEKFNQSLEELVEILFTKEYFGFRTDCELYVDKIYDYVDFNINKPISRNTPEKFQKYGKKILKYKANNNTSWYIFFDQKDRQFLINHIMNNHSQEFPDLMEMI
ncbi:hypothetical protein CHRY9390_02711 [Chryseobacterium aquaeductus]|uniref:Uncharacterized protein n=1 Tax=Chryseobacterium aquaeductus TaxID=2675056 RepID=A0A9N8QSW4_9FLAO|nr:hypothetical protein [Chryseobacterium aquaeductus]CAA7331990.1 hypothetical protein CHRY9390_02711 [Chryseobacterium potabilaquae]CAD7813790.1 hypothetical protein CHRY9390_02711 [Chryseobacterium aquaeductus]